MLPQIRSCFACRNSALLLITEIFILVSCKYKEEPGISIDYLGQKPPGMVAEIFAPGIITTNAYEHSAPAFSPDGSLVLWTVVDKNYRASMVQMKYKNGEWSSPARPTFADSTADDYYPSFSPDGKRLYFGSRRKAPNGFPGNDMRLWVVERNEKGWKQPQPFDTIVSRGKEFAHSITMNGTLYFSTLSEDGTNMNVQRSEIRNGSYTKPVLLPFGINSVDYEDGPYIAPDESFLILESKRAEGVGGSLDLYISFKVGENRWTVPTNMGPNINTKFSERFARLSPDGKYLFFGSSRNQSADNFGFDIYWIDAKIIDKLKNATSGQQVIDQKLGEEILTALSKRENERARVLLKQWLTNDPNNLDATIVYSSVLRKLKRNAEAEQLLDKTPSGLHTNTNILREKSLVKIGLNKEDEAQQLLKLLLTAGDQPRDCYLHLSNELLEMEMLQESEKYFVEAMSIHSNMYDYYRRAQACARVGEKDQAIYHLENAIKRGFTSLKDIENEKSFLSLRSHTRWNNLLHALK